MPRSSLVLTFLSHRDVLFNEKELLAWSSSERPEVRLDANTISDKMRITKPLTKVVNS
jgi:hypothetical protein